VNVEEDRSRGVHVRGRYSPGRQTRTFPLTTEAAGDEATVYRGGVAAGLIATEQGFKNGQPIRVLPFGYVAHDEAADPAASVDAAVTVADGVVRELAVPWGTWTY